MSKITIAAENAWIIRSASNAGTWLYHIAANQFDRCPAFATIYRSEADAQTAIDDMQHHGRVATDGGAEAVPLEGALKTYARPAE